VYPFRSRSGWLAASRYKHVLKAFSQHPPSDSLVQERLQSLARWGRLRAFVAVLLYLGILASLVSLFAHLLPALQGASDVLQGAAAFAGTFTGLFTVAFLFLTRLLGQIEADILTLLLTARHK
jgi:hypothetical protein